MSLNTDIVGYTKQLLKSPQSKEEEQAKRELVYKAFPAVASALILAVEALEKISVAEWTPCHECEGRCELVGKAEEALSDISTLLS